MAGNIDIVVNQVTANVYVGGNANLANISGNIITGTQPYITNLPNLVSVTTNQDFNVGHDLNVVGNITIATGDLVLSAPGAGNILAGGNIVTALELFAGTDITAQGNIQGGNLIANALYVGAIATDNYTYANGQPFVGGGNVTGNYGNANVAAYLPTYTGSLSGNSLVTTGSISGDNISALGTITASDDIATSGNVTADYFLGNIRFATGGANGGGSTYGNADVANFLASGTDLQDIITQGDISTTNGFFIGDGSQLINLPAGDYSNANVANYIPTDSTIISIQNTVANNTANISTLQTTTANNSANIITLQTQVYTDANASAYFSGGLANANIITTANVSGTFILGDGSQLINLPIQPGTYTNSDVAAYLPTNPTIIGIEDNVANNASNIALLQASAYSDANVAAYLPTYTGNLSPYNVVAANTISANLFIGNFQGNITGNLVVPGANSQVLFNRDGNAGASIDFTFDDATNLVFVNGNVQAGYFIGDGSLLTGLPSSYGNADVETLLSTGITSNVVTTGNVSGSFILGDGSQLTNLPVQTGTYGNANVAAYLPTDSSFTALSNTVVQNTTDIANNAANITTLQGQVYGNANVTTLLTSGISTNISTTGNVFAGYLYGDGSNISGLPANYGNADVETLLSTGITSNVVTTGNISGSFFFGNVSTAEGFPTLDNYSNANVQAYLPTDPTIISIQSNVANNSANIITLQNEVYGNANVITLLSDSSLVSNVVTSGNITGGYFIGDGSMLTGIAPTVQVYEFANIIGTGGYYESVWLSNYVPSTLTTITTAVTTTPTLMASFLTEAGYPGITTIPVGTIAVDFETQKASGTTTYYCYAEIWKRSNLGVETLLTTTDNTSTLAINTKIQQSVISFIETPITLASTDRILTKIYGVSSAGTHNIDFIFDDNTNTGIQLPALPASIATFIPYDGATANLNLGTHDLITTGNITGNYIFGNASQITGITTLSNGNSNVSIPTAGGNINFNVANSSIGYLSVDGSVALGYLAGENTVAGNVIAIGYQAGGDGQGSSAVALGFYAGNASQGSGAISIGYYAGANSQGSGAISIGSNSGRTSQRADAIAIGSGAGDTSQLNNSIAIGKNAGQFNQGTNSIAIGNGAGGNALGTNAIAIGYLAGGSNQPGNSIVISAASGSVSSFIPGSLTIYPVRNDIGNVTNVMYYNTSSKEVTYAPEGGTFSAYASSSQTIPTDVLTKVNFDSEEWDTGSNFASSTFTPTVAGYYSLDAAVRIDSDVGTGERMIVVYKNGAEYKRAWNAAGVDIGTNWSQMNISCMVHANGTTDYFEIYVQHGAGANRDTTAGSPFTYFQGCCARPE